MKKNTVYFIAFSLLLLFASRLMAWSDDVSGVLMPAPRGGGGISGEEAFDSIYSPGEKPVDADVLIDVE